MSSIQRVAFIGNHLPRRCGIATFTHNLHSSIAAARPGIETCVVAMTDPGRSYEYPPAVCFQIMEEETDDYVRAAEFLNAEGFDVVSLQHEYGIFGSEAGGRIIELISRLDMPVVTTCHTVLAEPTLAQRNVMGQIVDLSAKVVVMAKKGRELLRSVHGVPNGKIEVIPHGIPDFPFIETTLAKEKFGFAGKKIILTFGLLSPSKGIETVIEAMPAIIRSCPNAVYVVLGATHPNLVRQRGEDYRDTLTARVEELGMGDHVIFFNEFVDQARLLEFISMCDVYVTPYLNEAQMTSGTLSYSFGLGQAVVSTPYWHAKELLDDGRGILVPFGDAKAIGVEIGSLLTNDARRNSMRKRAYAASRSMTWPQTADRYLVTFEAVCESAGLGIPISHAPMVVVGRESRIPELRTGYFLALCDSTGMLQHAAHCVPDRSHGYCIDDNARALLFSSALLKSGDVVLPEPVTSSLAAFIQHAWNPDTGRFRNFMSYDRRWLDAAGSEDSHGRTLWALAECARSDTNLSRRRWAAALFKTALPAVEQFSSPRAWAFSLLGLDAYCPLVSSGVCAARMRKQLADKLMSLFSASESKDWIWFEDSLSYDNARLPQALIQTGLTTNTLPYIEVGLRSLRWLMSLQTAPSGFFRPVGTTGFGRIRELPEAFDQQPVEASATISACLAAARVDGSAEWPSGAMRAFRWFLGENDLQTSLIDPDRGSCLDGLHPDRANQNQGAESTLSYLLGLVEVSQFVRDAAVDRTRPASRLVRSPKALSIASKTIQGSYLASISFLEPPNLTPASGPGQGGCATLQAGD